MRLIRLLMSWLYAEDCRAWVPTREDQPNGPGLVCHRTRYHFGDHGPC